MTVKQFEFGGLIGAVNENVFEQWEEVYNYDGDMVFISKETFTHDDKDLKFDYRYAIKVYDIFGVGRKERGDHRIELVLVVAPHSLSDKVRQKVINHSESGECDYFDIINSCHDVFISEIIPRVNNLELHDKVIGVMSLVNLINVTKKLYLNKELYVDGTTGWDVIKEVVGYIETSNEIE